MKLRPYQIRALDELRERWRDRPLLVAPTGAGKTTIAAAIAAGAIARGRSVLFVAHRRELLGQAQARLPWGVSFRSVASRKPPVPHDVLIIDEAHRAAAKSYRDLVAAHPWPCVIGLTATPHRLDGQGLDDVFGCIIEVATVRELIDGGYLMRPRLFTARALPDLDGVKRRGRDYDPAALDDEMRGLVADAVKSAQGAPKPCVIFASGVRHSKALVAALGPSWAHVDGSTPKGERDSILADLRAGRLDGVSNVEILTEGWDLPALRSCVLARPTLSLALYLQMVGRVLRVEPGKPAPIVFDHACNVVTHGPPDAEIVYTLDGKPMRPKDAVPSISTCLDCYAMFPSGTPTCPQCGAERVSEPRKVRETPGVMIEADAGEVEREWYAKRVAQASKRRCLIGWARAKFKERFGRWPDYPEVEVAVYTVPGFDHLGPEGLRAGGLTSESNLPRWKDRADAAMRHARDKEGFRWKARRNFQPRSRG